jgi:hypothetical protein
MKIDKGCDVLKSRLTELLEQVDAVRRSLSAVNVGRATAEVKCRPEVESSFGDMAAVVANTLGDVNSRLGMLDQVLKELHARGAVWQPSHRSLGPA